MVTYQWTGRLDPEIERRVEAIADELAASYPKAVLTVIDTDALEPQSYAATATIDMGRTATIAVSSTMGNAATWDHNARADVANGFHPIGFCDRGGIEGVIAHEFGHVLAFLAGLAPDGRETERIVSSWMPGASDPGSISEYATYSPQETLAEAFAETRCARSPRHLSRVIARTLVEAYRTGSPLV